MTVILLVRHGHVEGIKPERFRGRADLALTETGEKQAELLALRIASQWAPSSIHTSPLRRCVATGAAIAGACGVPSEPLGGLIDLDYGAWQSRTYEDARASDPGLFEAWLTTPQLVRFPNGESLQDVATRTAMSPRIEVLDPRTVAPLDLETILKSVAKTGRLVLVDQAPRHATVGGIIAGDVAEHGFSSLKAPIVQVNARDATVPYSEPLEAYVIPDEERIIAAVRKVLQERR